MDRRSGGNPCVARRCSGIADHAPHAACPCAALCDGSAAAFAASKRPIVVGQARRSNFFDNARNRERTHFSSEHGLPAVSGSMHRFKSASRVGHFFSTRGRPPPGNRTWSVGPISQVVVEFVAAPPNRFRMEAGDLCDALEAPMPQTHGLTRRHPAPLLLIQPAQQQIELPMIFAVRMFTRSASRATALVNRQCLPIVPPLPWSVRQLTANRRFHDTVATVVTGFRIGASTVKGFERPARLAARCSRFMSRASRCSMCPLVLTL